MQSTSLKDNLNSDFLAAFSALLPKNAAKRVLVYVESDEDIAFWKNILTPFQGSLLSFDIQLPFKNNLEKGKNALLKITGLGNHLIICIDSDYDYLLQATTEQSRKINNNDFIFQTYTYSIENLLCFSDSLHTLCVQSTKNDTQLLNLEALLKLYSRIIYELFLWSVHFAIKQDTTSFTITHFCETVKILKPVDILDQCKLALQGLTDSVKAKISALKQQFLNDITIVEKLKNDLKPLGLTEDNAYLFAQGHLIKDNVVLMFLKPICLQLKNEKVNQIKVNAKHNEEKTNQINLYNKQFVPIETILSNNTDYKSCFMYDKIHNDLTKYVTQF